MPENLEVQEELKTTSDGRQVTKQQYVDEVKTELAKLQNLSDEELDKKLEEALDKEPEGAFKDFAKLLMAELSK